MLSFIFDLGGLLPGSIMGIAMHKITNYPTWILLAYPGVLSLRGILNGLFCGRLSTALHVGLVTPSLKNNTKHFTKLVILQLILSTLLSLIMGLLVCGAIVVALGERRIVSIVKAYIAVISTILMATFSTLPISAIVGFWSFRRGIDPDVVLYPIMSTVADTVVTTWYIMIVILTIHSILSIPLLIGVISILLIVFYTKLSSSIEIHEISYEIKEIAPFFIMLLMLQLVTGLFLRGIESVMGYIITAIMSIYPILIDSIGDLGSIIGSRLTTAIALGTVKGVRDVLKRGIDNYLQAFSALLLVQFGLSFIPLIEATGKISFTYILRVVFSTDMFASLIITIMVFMVVLYASRRGYDPDNFVNPVISTIADFVTTVMLYLVVRATRA